MCSILHLRSLWVLVIISVLAFEQSKAQDIQIEPTLTSSSSKELDELFQSYWLQSYQGDNKKSNGPNMVNISLDKDRSVFAILSPANLLADNYLISTSEPRNIKQDDLAIPYLGYIEGDASSQVRLTIDRDYMYGYVIYQKEKYFIEPANRFDKTLAKNIHVLYKDSHVKSAKEANCAASISKSQEAKTTPQLKSGGDCQIAELAIAVDYAYRQKYGGDIGAINQSNSVMNMVAGTYENAFADDIRFEIVEHFIPTCSGCNPWTSSTDANTLLSDFSDWGPTGFTNAHDIGQFWTDRNLCGGGDCSVAGLAWIGAVCGGFRYHILEDFTSTAWQLRVLVAHEMGHNFGANHDDVSSQHVMRPSIAVNTSSWSSQSINQVNTALAGFNCFEDCVIGSCTEIISATTSNCIPGAPGTYDLTIEIRHGGGGTATSFDVIVNGLSFNKSWSASPQIVVISSLEADGTLSNQVTLAANDGSDTGCAGTITYDEPTGDCKMTVAENFNSCVLPEGWNTASTNTYIWNGGDPLVQYEWKFDDASRQLNNYGAAQNSSSLKTIDGTCMALMDDDIISHNLYTGDVTLTSPIYDLSDFDTVKLKFDYNFHPFEDGGKGPNNSDFEVEVYDGISWISIHSDNDSTCPWNDIWQSSCTTSPDLDLSVHRNPEFRFRFIYSDGGDGSWTGMIALDNVDLYASVTLQEPTCNDGIMNGAETGIDCGGSCPPCDPGCQNTVIITPATPDGLHEAIQMITTNGTISITGQSSWSANNIEIVSEFEVTAGTEFEASNVGCQQ